jgi:nitrite reductase/ring-hydroxylating ferredoxin subunit
MFPRVIVWLELSLMGSEDGFISVLDEKELEEGKMKLVTVEGTRVLIIKQNRQIFVINNSCPHMACGLSGGVLDGLVIVCPCHDWRFDLSTGEYEEGPGFKLTKYDWKINSGKILVKLEEDET